jgi:hypothetical protein
MKESEYFQKASQDTDYRREKIMDLRYNARFTLWLLIVFVVLAVGSTLYDVMAEGNWFKDFGSSYSGCTLCAWMYSNAKIRLTALEVMDGRQSESPQAAVAAEA